MMSRAFSVFIPLVETTLGWSLVSGSPCGSTSRRISVIRSPVLMPALYAGLPLIGLATNRPSRTASRRIWMPTPLNTPFSWDVDLA